MLSKLFVIFLLTIQLSCTEQLEEKWKQHKIKKRPESSNKVTDIETSCNKESFEIQVKMEKSFKGIIFSKDFSRECRAQGTMDKSINLNLPPNACGVRTTSSLGQHAFTHADDEGLHYSVNLVIQMDKYLQQSSDQELIVKCWLKPKIMKIHSEAVDNMVDSKIKEMTKGARKSRMGRNHQEKTEAITPDDRTWLMEQARAWMELSPALPSEQHLEDEEVSTVQVGQPTMLMIKSTLPAGIGVRVTDCLAHDGLGEASQKLLDEYGCPIDEQIFAKPTLYIHKPKGNEINAADLENVDPEKNRDELKKLEKIDPEVLYKKIMMYQHATTTFGAFKFPDRARLHLTCGIELCKGVCPQIDCKALQKPQRNKDGLLRRVRLDKDAHGVIIDRLEVYNSIEVLAPNIELEDEASIRGSRLNSEDEYEGFSKGFSPGDKTVCMSPSKMALAFCVLGLIFLCALVIAFVSLLRAKKHYGEERYHSPLSFYTGSKSLFSASTSTSSGLSGSKLLLTDSPYLDQHSSSSNNWPYGRAY